MTRIMALDSHTQSEVVCSHAMLRKALSFMSRRIRLVTRSSVRLDVNCLVPRCQEVGSR